MRYLQLNIARGHHTMLWYPATLIYQYKSLYIGIPSTLVKQTEGEEYRAYS